MKKIYYLLILLLLLPLSFLINRSTYNFYDVFISADLTNYCYIYDEESYKDISTIKNSELMLKCVKNGFKWLVTFNNKNALQNAKTPQYKQVTANFEAETLQKSLNKINAKLIKIECYNNIKILFYYTPVWQDYKILGNNKVNLQIAVDNNITTIGYPMIYGSF